MNILLQIRNTLKSFYEKYDRYVNVLIRFLFALVLYLAVFFNTGYNTRITEPLFAVILALISAFLPLPATPIIMGLLIIAEFASVSLEVMAVSAVLMLLMMLLYFVFRSGKSILMAVVCLLCLLRIPQAAIPLALLISPIEVLVMVFGVLLYGLIAIVKRDLSLLSAVSSLSMSGKVNQLLTALFNSERLMLILLGVVAGSVLVSVIKKQRMNYAATLAIITGDLVYLMIMIIGDILFRVEINIASLFFGYILNALIAVVLIFFVINMDYRHTEQVEFEDDEYYYYVKAVPKMTVPAVKTTVETIIEEEPEAPEKTFSVEDLFIYPEEETPSEDEDSAG